MELLNDTGFQVSWFVGKVEPPRWSATVLVKATFRLAPGGVVTPESKQVQPTGDMFLAEDPARPLVYPSDFVFHKPRTDLLLAGTYHAPQARPVDVGAAVFRVGNWSKRLAVIGDRTWRRFGGQSPPQTFKSMSLGYERAYGGPLYAKNPFGRGASDIPGPDGKTIRPMPNLEDPNHLVVDPSQ